MILDILIFVIGIAVVLFGAKILVDGSVSLGKSFGVPPLLMGLTVVAFGTSTPELAVSVQSVLTGHEALALSNVVGSNICNILLILGVAAILMPLQVHTQVVRIDVPFLLFVSGVFWFFTSDGSVKFVEALGLLVIFAGYVAWLIRSGSLEEAAAEVTQEESKVENASIEAIVAPTFSFLKTRWGSGALIVSGLGLLVMGSSAVVDSAVSIAKILGIDEVIVGLTVVAIGTSLPELATTVVAALKQQKDIAVGSIIGSNLFNAALITGVAGLVAPVGLTVTENMVGFDIPFMFLTTLLCLPIFFKGFNIDRVEGLLFLALYVAYTVYLALRAFQHEHFENYHQVLFEIALPLILVVASVEAVRYFLKTRKT